MDRLQFYRYTLILFCLKTHGFETKKQDRLFVKLCLKEGMESSEIVELIFDIEFDL